MTLNTTLYGLAVGN